MCLFETQRAGGDESVKQREGKPRQKKRKKKKKETANQSRGWGGGGGGGVSKQQESRGGERQEAKEEGSWECTVYLLVRSSKSRDAMTR